MKQFLNNFWQNLRIFFARAKGAFSDKAVVIGTYEFTLYDKHGKVKQHRIIKNLITDDGFDYACDSLGNSSSRPAVAEYVAIGSGTTAEAATDTALETELDRKLGTYSHTGGTKVYSIAATFNAGEGTGAITESGVLNAATLGTLFNRKTFSVINKGADDVLTVTWTFTLS